MRLFLSSLVILAALAAGRQCMAADNCANQSSPCGSQHCCARCGCPGPCQLAVCRLVCETAKTRNRVFAVETKQFCVPNPGCIARYGLIGSLFGGCDACSPSKSCDGCQGTAGCGGWLDRLFSACDEKCLVAPQCGPVRCRKELIVKEKEGEEPVYRCKVEYLCRNCCSHTGATPVEEQAKPSPPPPAPPAIQPARQL